MLHLARFESSKSTLDLEEVNLNELIRDSSETALLAYPDHEAQFQLELCSESVTLLGSKEALRQAVDNLLSNAMKYTPIHKKVVVRLFAKADKVYIEVQDHGPGIMPEHQARIFERFYRTDKARAREYGGTGIGLSIVKHVALAHHGEVSLESVPGKGSLFRLTLDAPM